MKLLLIDVVRKDDALHTKYPPLGYGYLVSYLPKEVRDKFSIKVIIGNNFEEIDRFKPDVVGLSSVSENFNLAKEIARYSKNKGARVIVGKSHISALPECMDENMDVGVIGEGEETFKELMELLVNKKFNTEEFYKINGIAFHDNGSIKTTSPRPLVSILDSIPMPDRELLNVKPGDPIYIFTSRGCPYNCSFCFSARFWDKVRFFSAEYVIEEIRYLYEKYRPLRITICDDLFIANRERLKRLVELIKNERFYKKIKFVVSVRANMVDNEVAMLMREMGIDVVTMGLESGNERVLRFLKGETVNVSQNQKAIDILKRHKFQVEASFIIGSPDETEEEIMDTFSFIKKSKLDYFNAGVLLPLPGTPIWDYAEDRGLVSSGMDWRKLSFDLDNNFSNSIILSEKVNRSRLHTLYNMFKREQRKRYYIRLLKYFYRRPREIFRYVNKILI